MKALFNTNNYLSFCLLHLIIILNFSGNSFAQQPKTEPNVIDHRLVLDEVVISANKVEEPLRKLSQPVSIISSKKIDHLAVPTTADLLTSAAGLSVQKSQQGGGSPNLRGFEANRILLVVDGVRLNNLIFRAGHLQSIITIDPAILDRVEIIFGPSSTLYGSDALGGCIHMITKDPLLAENTGKKIFKLNASTRYSSANTGFSNHVDFNIGSNKFASFTSISHNTFGDLKMGRNKNPFYDSLWGERPYYMERFGTMDSMVKNSDPLLQKNSGYSQTDLMQKFLYKPNAIYSHRINLQFSTSTDIPRYDRLTETTSHGLKYADWYYGPQTRFLSAYDLIIKNKLGFNNIHFGLSAQYVEESRNSRKTGADFLTTRHEFVNVAGGNLDLLKLWNKHDLRLGAEFQLNTLKSRACNHNMLNGTNLPVDSRYPDGENNMNFIDVYISHRWDINDKLYFNQGFRTGYSTLYSSFVNESLFPYPFRSISQNVPTWSGSMGLVYIPTKPWKISLNFSTGYRVPNIDDLTKIFERPGNTIVVPNPDIKPERTWNTELWLNRKWENGLTWDVNIYSTLYNKIIVVAPGTYMGNDSIYFDGGLCQVLTSRNKEKAYTYGISSGLGGRINDAITVDAHIYYSYGRIKEEEGERPMNGISPFSGKVGADYRYKALNAGLFVLFNGWKTLRNYYPEGEDNEQYATPKGMPAWIILNMRIDYQINKVFAVQFGIDNILDTQYRVFSSGINAPGRNFVGSLRLRL